MDRLSSGSKDTYPLAESAIDSLSISSPENVLFEKSNQSDISLNSSSDKNILSKTIEHSPHSVSCSFTEGIANDLILSSSRCQKRLSSPSVPIPKAKRVKQVSALAKKSLSEDLTGSLNISSAFSAQFGEIVSSDNSFKSDTTYVGLSNLSNLEDVTTTVNNTLSKTLAESLNISFSDVQFTGPEQITSCDNSSIKETAEESVNNIPTSINKVIASENHSLSEDLTGSLNISSASDVQFTELQQIVFCDNSSTVETGKESVNNISTGIKKVENHSLSEDLTGLLNISSASAVQFTESQQIVSCDNSSTVETAEESVNDISTGINKVIASEILSLSEDLTGSLNISSAPDVQFTGPEQITSCDNSSIKETAEESVNNIPTSINKVIASENHSLSEDLTGSLNISSASDVQFTELQQIVFCDNSSTVETGKESVNNISTGIKKVENHSLSEDLTGLLNISSASAVQFTESQQIVSCDNSSTVETAEESVNDISTGINKVIASEILSLSEDLTGSLNISSAPDVQFTGPEQITSCDNSSIKETAEESVNNIPTSINKVIASENHSLSEDLTGSLNISSASDVQFTELQQIVFCDNSSTVETGKESVNNISTGIKKVENHSLSEDLTGLLNISSASAVQFTESQQIVSCDNSSTVETAEESVNDISTGINKVIASEILSLSEDLTGSLNISSAPDVQFTEPEQITSCDNSSIKETAEESVNNISTSINKVIASEIHSLSEDLTGSLNISSAPDVQFTEPEQITSCDNSSIKETAEESVNNISTSINKVIASENHSLSEDLSDSLNISSAPDVQFTEPEQITSCVNSSTKEIAEENVNNISTDINKVIASEIHSLSEDLTGSLNISSAPDVQFTEPEQITSCDNSSIKETAEESMNDISTGINKVIASEIHSLSADLTDSLNISSARDVQFTEPEQITSCVNSSTKEIAEENVNNISTDINKVIVSENHDCLNISSSTRELESTLGLRHIFNSTLDEFITKSNCDPNLPYFRNESLNISDISFSLRDDRQLCNDNSLTVPVLNASLPHIPVSPQVVSSVANNLLILDSKTGILASDNETCQKKIDISSDDSSAAKKVDPEHDKKNTPLQLDSSKINVLNSSIDLQVLENMENNCSKSPQSMLLPFTEKCNSTNAISHETSFEQLESNDNSLSIDDQGNIYETGKNISMKEIVDFSLVTHDKDMLNVFGHEIHPQIKNISTSEIVSGSDHEIDKISTSSYQKEHSLCNTQTILSNVSGCLRSAEESTSSLSFHQNHVDEERMLKLTSSLDFECSRSDSSINNSSPNKSNSCSLLDHSLISTFPKATENIQEISLANEIDQKVINSCEKPKIAIMNCNHSAISPSLSTFPTIVLSDNMEETCLANEFHPKPMNNYDDSTMSLVFSAFPKTLEENMEETCLIDRLQPRPIDSEDSAMNTSLIETNHKSMEEDESTPTYMSFGLNASMTNLSTQRLSANGSSAESIPDVTTCKTTESVDQKDLSIELNSEKLTTDLTFASEKDLPKEEIPLQVSKGRGGNVLKKSLSNFQSSLNEELYTDNMDLTIITESQKKDVNCKNMNTSYTIESADQLDFTCKPEGTILGEDTKIMSQPVIELKEVQDQKYSSGSCPRGEVNFTEYYSKQNHLNKLDNTDVLLNDCEETSGYAMDYTLSMSECTEISTSVQPPGLTEYSNLSTCHLEEEPTKTDSLSNLILIDKVDRAEIIINTNDRHINPEASDFEREIPLFNNPYNNMTTRKQLSESINRSMYLEKYIPNDEVKSFKENLALIMDLLERDNKEFEIYKKACETEKLELLSKLEFLQNEVQAKSMTSNKGQVSAVLKINSKEDLAVSNVILETDLQKQEDCLNWYKKAFLLSDSELEKIHELFSDLMHLGIDVGDLVSLEHGHGIDPRNILNTLTLLLNKYKYFSDDYNKLKQNYEEGQERINQLESQMKKYIEEQCFKCCNLKTECEEIQILLKHYTDQSKFIEESNKTLKSDLLLREKEVYKLQKDIELLKEEIACLHDKDQLAINDLEKNNCNLKLQLSDSVKSKEDILIHLREKSQAYEELFQSYECVRAEANDLNAKIIALQEEIGSQNKLNEVLETKYVSAERKLAEVQGLQYDHEVLIKAFSTLESEFKEYKLLAMNKDQEINDLTAKNKDLEKDLCSLRTDIENLSHTTVPKDDLNGTSALLHKTQEELRSISELYSKEKQKFHDLLNDLNMKDSLNNELKQFNNELKENNYILKNELSDIKKNYEVLINEKKSLEEKYDVSQIDLSKLSNLEVEYSALKQLYEKESDEFKYILIKKNAECEELMISNQNLEKEIVQLNELLENNKKFLDDNSIKMNIEYKQLKDELSKRCHLLDCTIAELKSLQATHSSTINNLVISSNMLNSIEQKNVILRSELKLLISNFEEINLRCKMAEAAQSSLAKEYSEIQLSMEHLKKNYNEKLSLTEQYSGEITALNLTVTDLTKKLSDLDTCYKSLKNDYEIQDSFLSSLQVDHSEIKNKYQQNLAYVSKLEDQLSQESQTNEGLQKEVEALKVEITLKKEKLSTLETDYESLILKHEAECSLVLTDLSSKYEVVKSNLEISKQEYLEKNVANEKLEVELQLLKNELLDIKNKYANLEGEHDALRKELDTNTLKSHALETTLNELEAKYSEACLRSEKLEKDYVESKSENTVIKEKSKALEDEIADLTNNLEKLKKELASEMEKVSTLETDYENLILKHETECSLVLTDLKSKYEVAKSSLEVSNQECLEKTAAYEKSVSELQLLNNEVLDIKKKYANLEGEHDVLRKELESNILKSQALETTFNELEAKYSKTCTNLEKLENKYAEAIDKNTILEEKSISSQCEIINLTKNLEKLMEELSNEKEKFSSLEYDNENLILKHETECSLVLTDLNSKYEVIKGNLEISKKECLEKTAANEKLEVELQLLNNELLDIKKKYTNLEGAHDVLRKELDTNTLKSQELETTCNEIAAKYSEACISLDKLQDKYVETVSKNAGLEEERKASLCKIADLTDNLEKLKEELNSVKENNGSVLNEYENLKSELKKLQEEKDSLKNVESSNIEINLKCEELERNLICRLNVINNLESEVKKLNEKTNLLESENECLNEKYSQTSSLNAELSSSLQLIIEEKNVLEKQLSQKHSDFNKALVEIEKFKHFEDLIMSYRKDYVFLNDECTKLQNEFSTTESTQFDIFFASVENVLKSITFKNEEVSAAKSSLMNKLSEIDTLNEQIKSLSERTQDAEIKSMELRNDNTSLKEKHQVLLDSHLTLKETYDSLLENFNKLNTEYTDLKKVTADQFREIGEKDRLLSEMLDTKDKYESLLSENETLVRHINEKESEIHRLNLEMVRNKKIHTEMNNEVEKLRKDVDLLGREKIELQSNLDNYCTQFDRAKEEAITLKQESETLRLEKCKYERDYQSAVDSLHVVQEQMSKMEKDFDEKMSCFTFVLKEKENFENKTLSLLKQNDELSDKLKNLTQASKEYEKSYSKLLLLENEFSLLRDEKALLEKKVCDLDKIKRECTDLKAEVVVKESHINELKTDIKQLKTNYHQKCDELQKLSDEVCSILPDCKNNSDIVICIEQVLSRMKVVEEELKDEKLKSENLDEECEMLYKDITYKDKMLGDLYQQHIDELGTVKDALEKSEKKCKEYYDTIEKLKAEIEVIKTSEPIPCTACIEMKRSLHQSKVDLVDRNSKISSLQQELEEHQNLLKKKVQEYRKKVASLQDELGDALSKLKSIERNTSESASQTDPTPLQLSGQGGIVHSIKIKEQEDKIKKIEKENMLLKKVCHNRLQTIKDLQGKLDNGGQDQTKKPQRNVLEELQNN